MKKRPNSPAKRNVNRDRTPQACAYQTLESRYLLAGLFGNEVTPNLISDPFAYRAVTMKEMVDRAANHSYIKDELVVALQTQTNQGPHAIATIDWSRMTGIDGTEAVKTLMTVPRAGNQSVSLVTLKLGEGDVFQAMSQLESFRRVMWSSPNFSSTSDPREFVPNDPRYVEQYHHALMQNDLAWDITLGSSNIIVGVTDDGVAFDHSDLATNMWKNLGDFPSDGIDNDGNGYVDDFDGWDFASNDWNPYPNSSSDTHGTHVAGIAAGRTNNNIGIAGTAGGSKIMALQFYKSGSPWTAAMINETFVYAADNGAHIVNTSYNIDGWVGDPVFAAGLQYLYDADVLHLNSAGNNGALNPPRQAFEQTLLVASTGTGDVASSFTNYGIGVDIAAPGGAILSTVTGNAYDTFSGTSMATPNAAGVAALIWSANPTWTRDQVAAQLVATTDNIDAINPTRAGLLGTGRVNSFRAVTESLGAPSVRLVTNLPGNGGFVDDTTIDQFAVAFDQIVDPGSVNNSANFELRGAGLDELFDTADDVVFTLDTGTYSIGTNRLVFDIAEGALDYGKYRLTMVSGGLQNPFGVALDGDGNGTAGDNFVSIFNIAPPPLGAVAFDRMSYQVEDLVAISVSDSNAVAPVSVVVTTSAGDSEVVNLAPQGFGKFLGWITATAGAANGSDGVLQVGLGQELTVTYMDADDGNGNPAEATDTAIISNIRQYDSDDVPVVISDNNTITSTITIVDPGSIFDLDLQLDITHTWVSDLDVFLIAPDGVTRIELFQDIGGNGDNFTDTYLDDEALVGIASGVAPFTGSFRPVGSFSTLDGIDAAGVWTLEIRDDAGGDTGTLNRWSLFVDLRSFDMGTVSLDRPTYAVSDTIDIVVRDANAVEPVVVEVMSTRGDVENVVLNAVGGGRFEGSIATVAGSANSGDGQLQVDMADQITVKYVDENDGSGNSNTVMAYANVGNVVRYDSDDIPVTISDNATFTSEIVITDSGTIADLDLMLDITHTWVSDLDVFLISTDGSTRIELFQDIGGNGDNFTNTYLDDEAAVAIGAGVAPFTGSFRPVGSLATVDGMSITGTWTLEVSDDAGGDTGTLNAWSLFIDIIPDVYIPDLVVSDVAGDIVESETGSQFVDFEISLSAATTRAVFVDYQTTIMGMVHGATAGEDFTGVADTLIFLPGETVKTVQVEVFGDRIMENHEQFGLNIFNVDGGTVIDAVGTATIVDDESWSLGTTIDFGPYHSPVHSAAVGMMDMVHSIDRGMGWTQGASSLEFVDTGIGSDVARDFALVQDGTFEIDLAGGSYSVVIGMGDPTAARDNVRIWVEGQQVGVFSTAAGEFFNRRFRARVNDGALTVRIEDLGGESNFAALANLSVQALIIGKGGGGGESFLPPVNGDGGKSGGDDIKNPGLMFAPMDYSGSSELELAGASSYGFNLPSDEDRLGRDQIVKPEKLASSLPVDPIYLIAELMEEISF